MNNGNEEEAIALVKPYLHTEGNKPLPPDDRCSLKYEVRSTWFDHHQLASLLTRHKFFPSTERAQC